MSADSISGLNAGEAVETVKAAETTEALVELRTAEKAGAARKSVLTAIESRRAEFMAGVEVEERVWSGLPLFGCTECDYEGFDRDDVVLHMRRQHGIGG